MTRRLAMVVFVLVLLVSLGGFTAAASPPDSQNGPVIRVTEQNQGQSVELRGEVLVVNLESNPATGYGWQVQNVNGAVLRRIDDGEWLSRSPGLMGAPGTQSLRFAGVGRGRTTLNLVYRRPWETATRASRSFSLQVRVTRPTANLLAAALPAAEEPVRDVTAVSALPAAYNWCAEGGCPPVRDQGACGSCWAFGTVGPLESAILIKDGVSRDLSEQYLVSCNVEGWGCDGGWWAHDYHEWKYPPGEPGPGAVYESDFAYTATDAPCDGPYVHHETIADWVFIGPESGVAATDAIKQAILDHGPVSSAVCVNTDFQLYTSGVFNPTKPCRQTNHAIVLVGWDDSVGAWILRNSWGPEWGEDGYMRIAYGKSLVGYSANYVVYGSTTPTPTPPPTGTFHVSAIDMSYVLSGRSYVVYTRVTLVDAANAPVSGATVSLRTTLPSGSVTASGVTGADGMVTFNVKSKLKGVYVSEVTNASHATYTYDPTSNDEDSASLTVP